MSAVKSWFNRIRCFDAGLVALLLAMATPGCLAETDDDSLDPIEVGTIDDGTQGYAPRVDLTPHADEAIALEVLADGRLGQPLDEPEPAFGAMDEQGDEGEPTPQPWRQEATGEPGDEGGPDPVPWDTAEVGPDPVPWHDDDDTLQATTTAGGTNGDEASDPF